LELVDKKRKRRNIRKYKEGKRNDIEKCRSNETNIFDYNSGCHAAALSEAGIFNGTKMVFSLLQSADGVMVYEKTIKVGKVYPVWLTVLALTAKIRFVFTFQQLILTFFNFKRSQSKYMILASIFNDNKDSSALRNKKKETGHELEMLLPVVRQLQTLFEKGNFMKTEKNTCESMRGYVAISVNDSVELPNLYENYGHASYWSCMVCDFIGRLAKGEKRKQCHHFRYSIEGNLTQSNIINRERYLDMVNGLISGPFATGRRSILMDVMLSFFPTQITVADSLHTLCLGLIRWLIEMLKKYFPEAYYRMVDLSNACFISRNPSGNKQNLKYLSAWKARDYLFWLFYSAPSLVVLAEFPDLVIQLVHKLNSIFTILYSKSEDDIVTAEKVLDLEKQFYDWENDAGELFNHAEFTPNNHRIGHIFRNLLQFGRPWVYSMFGSETANMIASKVISTQNPLAFIERRYKNHQFYHLFTSKLRNNQLFSSIFVKTKMLMFPNDYNIKIKITIC
jgi:hypothetical protein